MTTAEPRPPANAVPIGITRLPLSPLELPYIESPRPQAGFASPAADYIENTLDLNEYLILNPVATFYVRMQGVSMIEAGIFDGDLVTVDRSMEPRPNKIVVAVFQGEFFIKRLRDMGGRLALVSENSQIAFPTLFLDQDPDHIIWGCVTGSIKKH